MDKYVKIDVNQNEGNEVDGEDPVDPLEDTADQLSMECLSEEMEDDGEGGGRRAGPLNSTTIPTSPPRPNHRGWKTGPCKSCDIRETGHMCQTCREFCCNLCNQVDDVEDLSDIMCRECCESKRNESRDEENTEGSLEGSACVLNIANIHSSPPLQNSVQVDPSVDEDVTLTPRQSDDDDADNGITNRRARRSSEQVSDGRLNFSPQHTGSDGDSNDGNINGGGRGSRAGFVNSATIPSFPPSQSGDEVDDLLQSDSHSIDQGSIRAIGDEITGRFGSVVEVTQVGGLARLIAKRVWEENENMKRREAAENKPGSDWIEDKENNYLICVPCLRHVSSDHVPSKLKTFNRGHFGFLESSVRRNKSITQKMKVQSQNPLHLWCVSRENNQKKEVLKVEERSKRACMMVVTNGIYVLKEPTGSARDFIKLNNKEDLNEELDFAQKNDGSQIYFELRDICFLKLSGNIKEMIKSCETIGCTLDKVTIGSTAFTVIITYFFWRGSLRTVLNELFVMASGDGDGLGSAEMVCRSLMLTLGLSREELRAFQLRRGL